MEVEIAPTLLDLENQIECDFEQTYEDSEQSYEDSTEAIPLHLNIAMLIVGTRGDVQPFVAIGKRLKASIDSQ